MTIQLVASPMFAVTSLTRLMMGKGMRAELERPWVYPYPRVSDFAGRSSDHGPSKTQTKTQTTPVSLFTRQRRETQTWSKFLGRDNSDHGLNFGLPRGGVDPVLMIYF